MASKYAVAVAFSLIDGVSKKLDVITGKAETFNKPFGKALYAAQERVDAFGRTLKTMGTAAAAAGLATLAGAIKSGVDQFISLDQAVTQAGSLFKDLDPKSATFQASLEALQQAALDVAGATEFTATDTAGALSKMAMAGMTAQQSMELLMGTTNLATAAGTDLTTAVDIATDALGAFSLDATAANLERISDVMAKTTSTANTDLPMMFEAITYAGPGFTAAGQSMETLAASIGILANAGTKGSKAGTSLQALMTQLSKTAKTMGSSKSLGLIDYGISVKDAEGNFLPLFDILEQVDAVTSKMGSGEKSEFFTKFFGTQGSLAVNELLAAQMEVDGVMYKGIDALKAYQNQLENCGGAAQQMADVQRGSLKNQIEILKSAVSILEIKFVSAFKEKGSAAVQKLIEIVNSIDVNSLIAVADKVLDGIINIASAVWNFRGAIIPTIATVLAFRGAMDAIVIGSRAFEAFKTVTNGLQIANAALKGGSGAATFLSAGASGGAQMAGNIFTIIGKGALKLKGLLLPLATTIGTALSGAISAVGAAIAATPIGWVIAIIAAVAAAIAGIIALIKNWDSVSAWFSQTFTALWEKISGFAAWLGEHLMAVFRTVWDALSSFGQWLSSVFSPVFEALGNLFSAIGNLLLAIFEPAINAVKNAFVTMGEWLSGVFMPVWEWISEKFTAFSGLVQSVAGAIGDGLMGAFQAISEWLSSVFMPIWQGITDGISWFVEKISWLVDTVGSLGQRFGGFLADKINLAADFVNGKAEEIRGNRAAETPPTRSTFETNNSIYSRQETENTSKVVIGLDDGLKTKATYGAPPIALQRARSGGF